MKCLLISVCYSLLSTKLLSFSQNFHAFLYVKQKIFLKFNLLYQMRCRHTSKSSSFLTKNQFFELKTFSVPIVKNKILFLTISRYFLILNLCPLKQNYIFYDDHLRRSHFPSLDTFSWIVKLYNWLCKLFEISEAANILFNKFWYLSFTLWILLISASTMTLKSSPLVLKVWKHYL